MTHSFYTIFALNDFNYIIYNISCNGNDFEFYDRITDLKYSVSQIHYHGIMDKIFVVSISPKTRNYALYSFDISKKSYSLVYDLNNKNTIFASTIIPSKDIMYVDVENGQSTTLLGINLIKGSLETFYEPLTNDPYYTVELLNDYDKFIYALIYNRKIGIIQLISIDTVTEEVVTILSYDEYTSHYASCYKNNKIYSFMSNNYDESYDFIITNLETRTFTVKNYEGNKPLKISFIQ